MACCSLNLPIVHKPDTAKTNPKYMLIDEHTTLFISFFLILGLLSSFSEGFEYISTTDQKSRRWSPPLKGTKPPPFIIFQLNDTLLLSFTAISTKRLPDRWLCTQVVAGRTVFFHSAVNVFVIAFPRMDDGYVHVQWGLSLHMFSAGVALCSLISSSNRHSHLKWMTSAERWKLPGDVFWWIVDHHRLLEVTLWA